MRGPEIPSGRVMVPRTAICVGHMTKLRTIGGTRETRLRTDTGILIKQVALSLTSLPYEIMTDGLTNQPTETGGRAGVVIGSNASNQPKICHASLVVAM